MAAVLLVWIGLNFMASLRASVLNGVLGRGEALTDSEPKTSTRKRRDAKDLEKIILLAAILGQTILNGSVAPLKASFFRQNAMADNIYFLMGDGDIDGVGEDE
jgi:hypothetical protein